jgi:hypothetical protein
MTPEHNKTKHNNMESDQCKIDMDILYRDRYELISAYLDGEVTPEQRQQVQCWLNNEPQMQCLYQRLLKLRQGIQTLPCPESNQNAATTVRKVFLKIEHRRMKTALMTAGGAIAAIFVASIANIIPVNNSPNLQLANNINTTKLKSPNNPKTVANEPRVTHNNLMVALNEPIIEIPKTAVATDEYLGNKK